MNKLSNEKSPYLQQHKNNPVEWFPWGDEAFNKAKAEKKPIFLSIGYSSCHWCHVMEEECFEDQDVAKALSENFISIKVDREERPDIDSLYMLVCQMMTGQGGWPLTIFMTPNKEPFFAGTFFPKESNPGRMGFLDLLKRIHHVWNNDTRNLHTTIQSIRQALQEAQRASNEKSSLSVMNLIEKSVSDLKEMFDSNRGGFGHKPKFPSAHKLLFLMGQTKDKESLAIVEKTLLEMHRGALFDHVRGGFHRYSTDENWEVPHFEKMLYDQALMAMAYLDAYQLTQNEIYKCIAEKTLNFVLKEMTSSEGAFYSAYDADSEGEEGTFYIWSVNELTSLLSESEYKQFSNFFELSDSGNYLDEATQEKTGKNILFLKDALTLKALDQYKDLEKTFDKLQLAANNREKPFRDDKNLLDWNCLFSVALLKGYEVLNNEAYLKAAKDNLNFINKNMVDNKTLFHRFCDGEALKVGFLDDYASYILLLLQFYKLTQDEEYLIQADDFYQEVYAKNYDASSGSFYLSSSNELGVKTKDIYDGAYPSGNSLMVYNTVLLSHYTGQKKFEKILTTFFEKNSISLEMSPSSTAFLMKAFHEWQRGSIEVQVVGVWSAEKRAEIESILRNYYLPGKFVKNIETDTPQAQPHIKVCQNQTCSVPVLTISELKNLLNSLK